MWHTAGKSDAPGSWWARLSCGHPIQAQRQNIVKPRKTPPSGFLLLFLVTSGCYLIGVVLVLDKSLREGPLRTRNDLFASLRPGAAILAMMAPGGAGALPVAPGAVLVKVCGVRRQEDADCAVGAGANLIGVIFAKSKRQASQEEAGIAGLGFSLLVSMSRAWSPG